MTEKTEKLISFAYKTWLVLWCIFYFVFLTKQFIDGRLLFYFDGNNVFHFTDFIAFYMCGKLVWSDMVHDIYAIDNQLRMFNQVISPAVVTVFPFAQNLPFFFLFMAPFSLLPLKEAYVAFMLLTMAFGFYGLSCLLKNFSGKQKIFFLLAVCSSFAVMQGIRDGQTIWLLTGLTALFCHFFLQDRPVLAGIMLALLGFKPQYLLFLCIPVLAERRVKILLSVLLTFIVLFLICALVFGLPTMLGYPNLLFRVEDSAAFVGVFETWMVSVRGLLSLVLNKTLAFRFSLVFMSAALLALYMLWRKNDNKNWCLALTVLLSLIASAHTHMYDLILLSVPAALTLETVNLNKINQMPAAKRLWHYLFLGYPLLGGIMFFVFDHFPCPEIAAIVLFICNLLFICTGWRCLKQKQ